MSLGAVSDGYTGVASASQGWNPYWDWKNEYVSRFQQGAGNELFSIQSVTPDTILLLAGPPRIHGGGTLQLSPLGLVTDVSMSVDNQLVKRHEIGTDLSYFTRGKSHNQLNIGAMIANRASLLKILTRQSPTVAEGFGLNGNNLWIDPNTDAVAKPFGILMIFKTKGGTEEDSETDIVSSIYLENCNIGNFNMSINAGQAIVSENIAIQFDHAVPTDAEEH